jgi:UDP:flavonoid glycosyltransferase YjiC (YdhE family)
MASATGRRVVLATTGTLGDVLPFVAIALELRNCGLDPVLAAMEDYRWVAEAEGLAFHAVRPGNLEMRSTGLDEAAVAKAVTADLRAGFDIMLPHLALTLADLVPAIAGADLVIGGTLSAVARIVAEAVGVPMVTVILQPMGFLSVSEPPTMRELPFLPTLRRHLGPGIIRLLYALGSAQGRSSLRPVIQLRSELGLPRVRDELVDGPGRTERIFAMYPPAFAPLPPDAPPQASSAGFAYYDGPEGADGSIDTEIAAFLTDGPPPLVFTLGSFVIHAPGDFYETSARIARRLGRRALLLVGRHAIPKFASLAGNGVAVAGYAPHSLVFPRAAAVIHHGGIGTTAQALRAGVPQLVCPLFGDQFDNARRLRSLGVARVVRLRRYTEARAAATLTGLLASERSSAATRALAPAVIQADGPAIIASWIAGRIAELGRQSICPPRLVA